jgi:flagellar motor switch protein FliN/FliY
MGQEDIRPAAAELQSIGEPSQAESFAEMAAAAANTAGQRPRHLDTVLQIPVSVKIVLGSATMPVANVLKLGRGAVVPLDRKVGEPVDVVVNGRRIASGEITVLENDPTRFGIRLTRVVTGNGAA